MTEQELRALIRESVARHLGDAPVQAAPAPLLATPAPFGASRATVQAPSLHPSHYQYVTLINVGDSCVIEPGVTCNHCGYCKTHGH
jgi:hypothetical protein